MWLWPRGPSWDHRWADVGVKVLFSPTHFARSWINMSVFNVATRWLGDFQLHRCCSFPGQEAASDGIDLSTQAAVRKAFQGAPCPSACFHVCMRPTNSYFMTILRFLIDCYPKCCPLIPQVKAAQMTLFLRRPGDPVPEEIGADDGKTLGSFGVQVRPLRTLMRHSLLV